MNVNFVSAAFRDVAALGLSGLIMVAGCSGNHNPIVPMPPAPRPPPATGIVTLTINPTTAATAPSQNPTFGGMSFGNVGPYQKIRGTASGKLDPKDPHNAMITDITLAPVDANGLVDYNMDFYILTPVNQAMGNHKVFFELPNRGSKVFGGHRKSACGQRRASRVMDAVAAIAHHERLHLAGLQPGPERQAGV